MNRVWVYQANRFLTSQEVISINELLENFVSSWTAHGSALAGKAYVVDNLFIIIEVDEEVAGVTGCSIDKSVNFIKALGEKFLIDFFDRMRVAYISESGELAIASREEFQSLVTQGKITTETIVYNNLVQTSEELQNKWKTTFGSSWHSRVF